MPCPESLCHPPGALLSGQEIAASTISCQLITVERKWTVRWRAETGARTVAVEERGDARLRSASEDQPLANFQTQGTHVKDCGLQANPTSDRAARTDAGIRPRVEMARQDMPDDYSLTSFQRPRLNSVARIAALATLVRVMAVQMPLVPKSRASP